MSSSKSRQRRQPASVKGWHEFPVYLCPNHKKARDEERRRLAGVSRHVTATSAPVADCWPNPHLKPSDEYLEACRIILGDDSPDSVYGLRGDPELLQDVRELCAHIRAEKAEAA